MEKETAYEFRLLQNEVDARASMFQPFWVHVKYRPLPCVTMGFFPNITLGKIILFHWVQNKKRRKEIEEGIRFCLQQKISIQPGNSYVKFNRNLNQNLYSPKVVVRHTVNFRTGMV